jgi:hypothetical protein
MNLSNSLSSLYELFQQVPLLEYKHDTMKLLSEGFPPSPEAKPVIQLNAFPVTLDPEDYKNPKSSTNPNGNLRSLFALRQLVDPVPSFSHFYSPSASASTEEFYKMIIEGADISLPPGFAMEVIGDSKKQFEVNSFPNLDGMPGSWRPVYTNPGDWYDVANKDRFRDLALDLKTLTSESSPFASIGSEAEVNLQLILNNGLSGGNTTISLSPQTHIHSITMKYLFVTFVRPWFNPIFFRTQGWYLSGQPVGYCSSGKLDSNDGVLPLVPVGMLIGTNVAIDADWAKPDAEIIDQACSDGKSIHLGPFMVGSPQNEQGCIQLIGWISTLVPLSPKASQP